MAAAWVTEFPVFSRFLGFSIISADEMQQQEEKIEIKKRKKICSIRGCINENSRIFSFPQERKDRKRKAQWVEVCDNPKSMLPPEN